MAVTFASNASFLTRSAAYLARASSWTRFLFLRNGTSSPALFRNYLTDGDPAFVNSYIYMGSGATDTVIVKTFNGTTTTSSLAFSPANGAWAWIAAIYDSAAHTIQFYGNGALIDTSSLDLSTFVFATQTQQAGTATSSAADDSLCYIREWQAALTPIELAAEAISPTAVRITNLLSDTQLGCPDDLSDEKAATPLRNWTLTGTIAYIAGPLITGPVVAPGPTTKTLFVPGDGVGDAALIDPGSGSLVNQTPFFSRSGAARLPNGLFSLRSSITKDTIYIWSWNGATTFTSVAFFDGGKGFGFPFTTIDTNFWTCQYLGLHVFNQPSFYKYDQTGQILKSVGPISIITNGVEAFTPSLDETVAYYNNTSANTAIKRWDLVNNVALTDLVANIGASTHSNYLYTVPGSTDIVAILYLWTGGNDGGTRIIRRYTATGTVVYNVTFATVLGTAADTIEDAAVDPSLTSVWVRWPGPPNYDSFLGSRYQQLSLADGSTLGFVDNVAFEEVPASTCPLLVLGAPGPVTTYIRRLRQTAHLSNSQMYQFFHSFQLDGETGVGLTTGQGSDPQVMLSWSDDGGHTWSAERWTSFGKSGEFRRRAMWRQLGRSRDRVWRIVVSDPVPWRFLQAIVNVDPGTS